VNRDAASLALSVAALCTGPTVVLETGGPGSWPTAAVDEVAIEPLESRDGSGTEAGHSRRAET